MSQAEPQQAPAGVRLESWKEIAAYLKREVRTVRRWEKSEGLPVHRHVHHKLASVYAFTAELDAWRERREAHLQREAVESARTWRLHLTWACVLVFALGLTAFVLWRPRVPSQTTLAPLEQPIAGRLLAAATGEGQRPTLLQIGSEINHLVLTPDGKQLYASDGAGAIHVLDTATHRVTRTIPLDKKPFQLRLSPDGGWIYVATTDGDILRLSTTTHEVDTLAEGIEKLRDLTVTNDGSRLYLTALFGGLHVLDVRTRALREVPTLRCPVYATTVPGKDLFYVSYQCGGPGGRSGHDAIDVRVASTGEARATISGPPNVGNQILASPDGAQVWVDGGDACISPEYDHQGCPKVPGGIVNVFRVDDNRHLASLGLAESVGGFAFFPDGSRAVLGGEKLRVVDVASLRVIEELPVWLTGLAVFSPDRARVYLPGGNEGKVVVLELRPDKCVPAPRLASWWAADGSPVDIRDGNTGELRNGARFAPAWVGQGFEFDGADAYVHVPKLSNFDPLSDFTLALWIKPASANAGVLFDHGQPGRDGIRLERTAAGTATFCHHAGQGCAARTDSLRGARILPRDTWSHLAIVRTQDRLALYVNGELDAASGVPTWAVLPDRHDLRIGGPFGHGRFFAGKLDEIQIFGRALPAEEIKRIHAAGRWGVCYQ
jgi:YVTN family beta-propeller protein